MKKVFLMVFLSVILVGCATTDAEKQQQIANAPLVNAGLITDKMALDMANADAVKIQQLIATSQAQAVETWKNKMTHDAYQFTSLTVSVNSQGQACRTYQIKALVGGRDQQIQTKACRQSDGSWQAHNTLPQA